MRKYFNTIAFTFLLSFTLVCNSCGIFLSSLATENVLSYSFKTGKKEVGNLYYKAYFFTEGNNLITAISLKEASIIPKIEIKKVSRPINGGLMVLGDMGILTGLALLILLSFENKQTGTNVALGISIPLWLIDLLITFLISGNHEITTVNQEKNIENIYPGKVQLTLQKGDLKIQQTTDEKGKIIFKDVVNILGNSEDHGEIIINIDGKTKSFKVDLSKKLMD